MPLLLVFHGFAGDADLNAAYTGLPARASEAGYLVVSPNGLNHNWQLGGLGADGDFVSMLLGRVFDRACIDQDRVFAAGFSAGAAFAIAYTCSHESVVAAVATVAVEFQLGCTTPKSILALHRTLDPAVPFTNGAIGLSLPGIPVRGTELNMGDWARLNRCQQRATISTLGSQVTKEVWPKCSDHNAVVLYRIEAGGHSWPGRTLQRAVSGSPPSRSMPRR